MLVRNVARSIRQCSIPAARNYAGRFPHRPLQADMRRWFNSSHSVYATPPPLLKVSDLSMQEYHQLSDATMDTLLESLETLLDELGEPDYEVEYSSGVLTLNLGDKGTYVINKQPPNKQIWLSSPFSGPKRYDYVAESRGWYYFRDGVSLRELLETELSRALGIPIELGLSASVGATSNS